MCLAIPGKVVAIDEGSLPLMGRASFGGIEKQVCLDWLPEVRIGEYVVVHVGFAIARIDEEDARITIGLEREMNELALRSAAHGRPAS